jgi:hypothetical protein
MDHFPPGRWERSPSPATRRSPRRLSPPRPRPWPSACPWPSATIAPRGNKPSRPANLAPSVAAWRAGLTYAAAGTASIAKPASWRLPSACCGWPHKLGAASDEPNKSKPPTVAPGMGAAAELGRIGAAFPWGRARAPAPSDTATAARCLLRFPPAGSLTRNQTPTPAFSEKAASGGRGVARPVDGDCPAA